MSATHCIQSLLSFLSSHLNEGNIFRAVFTVVTLLSRFSRWSQFKISYPSSRSWTIFGSEMVKSWSSFR
jgi:hypothetical protein